MEELVQKIWTLSKADRIQNVDYAIGIELTNLYCLLKEDPLSIPQNLEDLLLALIVINKGQISITNAHLIGLICVFYYKRQNPPNYWKLIPLLTEEIKKLRKPSIYLLGLLSRRLCDGFKSQLPMPIQFLLNSNDETLFPLICQCFRRIIKGTGTFLIQQIPDIFGFIFAGSSSTNESIRIESVKSIPTLLEYAHISIKKLLPIVGQLLQYTSQEMRFAVAKSLAKLIFIGSKLDSNPDGKRNNDNIADAIIKDTTKDTDESTEKNKESPIDSSSNPFKYCFKIILQFAQNEKNAETLVLTMHILLRFYQPIEIVKKLRTFTNFILCLPSLKLPSQSLVFLSNGIIKAVISVVGSTIGNSICYHLVESIKNSDNDKNRRSIENLNYTNEQKAMIALTALINFDASTKVVATAAKQFYPLLSSGRKDIQKVCISFFSKLGRKEANLGRIFIDTFSSFLATIDDSRVNDIDGFSKAAAAIIASYEDGKEIPAESIEKVKNVITSFLTEKNYSTCKMAMAYLLLASLAKGRRGYEMIPFVFNFTQLYLKDLPQKTVHKFVKKTIKYISLYFIQIIANPPNHYEKLKSTIRGFILIILPNVEVLSKSGRFLFFTLSKSWFENNPSNNDKVNDFACRSLASLFLTSFEQATRKSFVVNPNVSNSSNESHCVCGLFSLSTSLPSVEDDLFRLFSADIGNSLYNFEAPSNGHVSRIDVYSLIETFGIKLPSSGSEFRSDDDFYLLNVPFWASKCSQSVLDDVIPPLFEFAKNDVTQIVSKLKLLTSFIDSRREFGLTKAHFDRLINLEQNTRITSNENLNSQEQRFMQIQFALAQAVSLWFISHSTFSDSKLVNNSDLNILMNNKSKFFSSLLIAFTSEYLCDEIQVQALLFLMQNIQNEGSPVMLFAFRRLLSSFKMISDFSVQVGNFLENLSYSSVLLPKPSLIREFTKCVLTVSNKLNYIQMIRIIQNLLHFPSNSNYAKLNGLIITSAITKLMRKVTENQSLTDSLVSNSLFDFQRETNLSLQTPLPILMCAFSSQKVIIPTLDDVPLLFMMLQQFTSLNLNESASKSLNLNEDIINDCILRVFHADCNVKKWTNFAKRIVIIGCVPPAERKGDIRILPTSSVLICAIKIAVLLVPQIRSTMELRCVDDIVSIAFTAIHMENRKIDFHCYSILSSVITCFEDVRNQEGSLLDVYFSQFHPTFCHAFDEGKRELRSVASYVIAYFRYVENNRKKLIGEVTTVLVDGLKRMKFSKESLTVFCRVASLVNNSKDSKLDAMFVHSSSIFFKSVLLQKRALAGMKEELPNFISKYQNIQKVYKTDKIEFIPDRIILALLLSELRANCNSINLNAVTNSDAIVSDNDAIDFVLRTIANSNLLMLEADEEERIRKAVKENEERQKKMFNSINSETKQNVQQKSNEKNKSDDFDNGNFDIVDDDFADNDLDQSAFWVFPVKRPSSVNRFLVKVTSCGKAVKLFESILTLSLSPPICFGAICNMLKSGNETINSRKHAALIASTVLSSEANDECLALFKFMFEHLSIEVIDYIVSIVVQNDGMQNEKRFEILRYAFIKLNGFEFNSINSVVSFLQQINVLLPDGINFIGSLLVSPKTALTAVYIMQSGLLAPIATATVSPLGMRVLPRILHFFNTALNIVKKICNREDCRSFSVLVSRVAIVSLAQVANVKEKAAVVRPACLLIKNIDKDIIEGVFNSVKLRKNAIISVKPQKQTKEIQLLTFADVSNRKSNTGWQNLEIESDDE